jgi:hypothetical protein
MPRDEKVYRRLSGRDAGLLSYSRLWLGPDHLLLARTAFFSEEYKRFYFRDIQAVVTRRTERREILTVILIFTTVVFGVLAAFTDAVWHAVLVVITLTLFVALLVNWLRGPTCVCHLRTAVQTEELSPLKRSRATRRVIDKLKPNIERAQGALAAELLQPKPPVVFSAAPSETAAQPASQATQPPPPTSFHEPTRS